VKSTGKILNDLSSIAKYGACDSMGILHTEEAWVIDFDSKAHDGKHIVHRTEPQTLNGTSNTQQKHDEAISTVHLFDDQVDEYVRDRFYRIRFKPSIAST